MTGFVIFKVGKNNYAIDIELIQRIIEVRTSTEVPNAHPLIDSMMSYEGNILHIVNFRKMIGVKTYEEELRAFFLTLKEEHLEWMTALEATLFEGVAFRHITNPHQCELGKWLDKFISYDERMTPILNDLKAAHKFLHVSAEALIAADQEDMDAQRDYYENSIKKGLFAKMMKNMDLLMAELHTVANSYQKFLVLRGAQPFILKVDEIDDIAYYDEHVIKKSDAVCESSVYLDIDGVLEHNETLINVIKSVRLPVKGVK